MLSITDAPFSPRDFLFTLLLKVGVAASIAALLARWNTLRRVLFTEERDVDQKIKLMLFLTPPLILGVTLRLVGAQYRFADLSLEGAFLMGLLGGRVVGPIGGAIITVPALIAHEWLAMPAASLAGLWWFDAAGDLIKRAVNFTFTLEYSKAVVKFIRKVDIPWNAAAVSLRWSGTRSRGTGDGDKAEVAVRD
jgi:two-component system LytT family sensor kinase